jgi:hypothetical protein
VGTHEEEDEENLYLREDDFDDLRTTQLWWQRYLASIRPGQQKISDWFRKVSMAD